MRLVRDGQSHHGGAVLGSGQLIRFLPRVASRYPTHAVKPQLRHRHFCQRDVRVVNRVEAAAEKTDPLCRQRGFFQTQSGFHSAQSRGFKKSVYSRASGVPASGLQL
jgi:hypothetical protein